MSWMKHTGCRYHTQDTGYYCGAAAAMMVLSEIGVPYSDLDQDDLYTSNHDHNAKSGWSTDPYGLRHTLVDRRPAGFPNTFVVHKPTAEADGTRDLVYTLHHYGVSPAALVYGCMHWIVVPGLQTDVEPVTGASYTLDGFWIHNPIHHATPPPPPHDASDDCGTGGTHGDANDFVTYADWQATYFTGCNYDDPGGADQFISVCDPDQRNISFPRRRERSFSLGGGGLLKPEPAVEWMARGLREYGLHEDKRAGAILKAAKPGKPLLVLRIDKPNHYYYLVPWEADGVILAFAKLDARFGLFHGFHLREKPVRVKMLERSAVLDRVAHRTFELPEGRGRIRIHPEAVCLAPTLVWRPCWESFSPHLPFYKLSIGEFVFYARIDGEVFTSLTITGRGV